MKKIVIHSNIIWTISNFRRDLIRDLKDRGFDVLCVAARDRFSDASETVLAELGARFIPVEMDRKGVNPLRDLLYMMRLYRIYRREAPDLALHFTVKPNIFGTLTAKILGIPVINTVNGLGSGMIGGGMLARLLERLYRFSFRFSDRVLFQNREDLAFFRERGLLGNTPCGYVPGSGIDTACFDGCERKREKGEILFLMVARLLKDKGVYEYIEACRSLRRQYPAVRCLLGGVLDPGNPSAVREEELADWIREGIVEYLGQTDEIREFFSRTDVVVLPSYREGLSRVLLEAASCRKPIVTTDVPGCRDVVIEGESGYLCAPQSAESLAEALAKMAASASEFPKMGERGRRHVEEHFSAAMVNRIYFEAMEEVMR